MSTWQLQEAKARLSEVLKKACEDGHQEISVRGEIVAIVLSKRDYRGLKRSQGSLVEFMRRSPFYGLELNFERQQTRTRRMTDLE